MTHKLDEVKQLLSDGVKNIDRKLAEADPKYFADATSFSGSIFAGAGLLSYGGNTPQEAEALTLIGGVTLTLSAGTYAISHYNGYDELEETTTDTISKFNE